MANLQRVFGDDGLPYLIDTSGEGFNAAYMPMTTGDENLELGLEPLSFTRNSGGDMGYQQDMNDSREVMMTRPVAIGGGDSGNLSKLNALTPENTVYQASNAGDIYFKQTGDGLKTQFKKEYGYTPSSGELNQYAKLSSKSSAPRSVAFLPEKIENNNTKRISENSLDNIRNGSLTLDSDSFLSFLQKNQGKIRSNSDGKNVRVYSSNAFGIPGLNHAYVGSPDTDQQKGRDGLFGITLGTGGYGFENPYHSVTLPEGVTARDFMNKIQAYPGWNKGLWVPWFNDCHNDVEAAFEHVGVPYPGAPNGRLDIDDDAASTFKRIMDEAQQWANTRMNGDRRR
jgi:hypothetical protein